MTTSIPGVGEVAVLCRALEACPDPIVLYRVASDEGRRPDTLLFESADHSTKSGDKSFIMTRAALRIHGRGLRVEVRALSPNGTSALGWIEERLRGRATVCPSGEGLVATFAPLPTQASERDRLLAPSPLEVVRAAILGVRVTGGALLGPMLLGSFSYDLLGVYEHLPEAREDPANWPDFELWFAEELIAIHHRTRRTTVLRYVIGGVRAASSYNDAERALAASVELCTRTEAAPVALEQGQTVGASVDIADAEFCDLVLGLKQHIVKGDVFQIVASRTFSVPCAEPLKSYTRLRAHNPSPYMFYLNGSAGILFGASPESALTVRRDKDGARRATINPIAGTRQRGRGADGQVDRDLDTRIEAELRLDEKEVAEHMMLVDLARNDVARVSKAGTRAVERLLDVVRYSHVMHLVSLVSGELQDELDALHAYVATMNMGTLVGAPKLEAAKLLRRYEASRRGPYGGAVGYLTSDGELDTCIVIRSARVQEGVAFVRAGAGVVYDSDPEAEAMETRRKAQAVLSAVTR